MTALLLALAAAGCSADGDAVATDSGGETDSGGQTDSGGETDSGGQTDSGGDGGSSAESGGTPEGVIADYEQAAAEIAENGGETTSGDWRVAYIVEPAEPWYEQQGDEFSFREPAAGETHHIEILPYELATGRLVPMVPIQLEIIDENGEVVDTKDLDFFYTSFFHYASNFSVPDSGVHTLRATLEAPTFLRHGEQAEGPALAEGVTVEFEGIELEF